MNTAITVLSVRFAHVGETTLVKQAAERAGVNISTFLREAALRYARALDAENGGKGWEERKMKRRVRSAHLRVIQGGAK